MGFHHGLSGELASPDLDVPSARLRSFRPEPRRTAHRERLAARGQRRASVSPASERDRIPLAQFDGRGVVCASSHQRRVRRLGSRTQERIEHAVLSARAVGVWLVRAQTGTRPLHRGCWVLRALAARQAAGDHISISAFAVGLLAARPDGRSGQVRAIGERAQVFAANAPAGEGASFAALRGQRGGHHGGSERRARRQGSCPFQPAVAHGNNHRLVCALSGQSILAGETASRPIRTPSISTRHGRWAQPWSCCC